MHKTSDCAKRLSNTSLCKPTKIFALVCNPLKRDAAGLLLGILASRVLASIVYQATPRDPLVLACVVLAMALLGLFATWIPAQRVLHIDALQLLREE